MVRILLVDDDENALRLVREKLRSEGMDVLISTCGQEGIDKAKQERPDLGVTTDLMMPEINGYAVARAIREDESMVCTPIIMLTAQNHVDEVIKGLAMGCSTQFSARKFSNISPNLVRQSSKCSRPCVLEDTSS